MDAEVHEVFTSFQGEGGTVPGSCMGRRQVFVRLRGCDLGCEWCDTAGVLSRTGKPAKVEPSPGERRRDALNPMSSAQVLDAVLALGSPSLHSVSLTGGEPLLHAKFLGELLPALRREGLRTFLETNGSDPVAAGSLARHVDFASVDVKDRSANAVPDAEWEGLVGREVECCRLLKAAGAATYAKLVVTGRTRVADVERVAGLLAEAGVPLAIQPVTPLGPALMPSRRLLLDLFDAACERLPLESVSLSVQGHRAAGMP